MYGIDDPSSLLQPWKNVKQFSEELYGMFKRSAPPGATATDEPGKSPPDVPAPEKARDDPAGIGIGATRKQRLAEAVQARRDDPAVARVGLPSSRQQATPHPDSGPRRTHQPEPPAEGAAFSVGQARPAQREASGSRKPEPAETFEADHALTRRVVPDSQSVQPVTSVPRDAKTRAETPRRLPAPSPATQQAPAQPTRAPNEATAPARTPREVGAKWEPFRVIPNQDAGGRPLLDTGGFATPSGGGGSTVFMGVVRSGSGNTYKVTLYQNGPAGDGDDSDVTVTIPMIAHDEVIPPTTWLAGIFQFSDSDGNPTYSCQPPVWMS